MYREAYILVDLDALKHNVEVIQKHTQKKIMAVVKANAYGCGIQGVYPALKKCGIHFFAVSSLEEAIALRKIGCEEEILIFNRVPIEHLDFVEKLNLTLSSISLVYVQEVINSQKKVKMHLKIDTGMSRIGLFPEEVAPCLQMLEENINVTGIYTHFASADEEDDTMLLRQYECFVKTVQSLNRKFDYIHCANSDAAIHLKDSFCNFVRVGGGLYGLNVRHEHLKQVVGLYGSVVCKKYLPQGTGISYGSTFKTVKPMWTADIAIGYADGWSRKNQNRHVYYSGKYYQMLGRICMDQLIIESDDSMPVGSVIEFFGKNISVFDVADELDTISYEVVSNLSDRLARVYLQNGEVTLIYHPRIDEL